MHLNKKSLKQQGGQMIPEQPGMQPNPPQVDPQIKQISDFFMMSIQQGKKPEEVVMMLMEKQVDQQSLAQAMMVSGMQEEDIMIIFKNVEKMQRPADPTGEEINQNPQELSREQYIESDQDKLPVLDEIDPMMDEAKSGIEIKKKNRGKFTRWAKARGMGVQEAAKKVMANKEKYSPAVVKMANFAKNAAKFKREEGGEGLPKAQFNINMDFIKSLTPQQYTDKYQGKTDYKQDTEDVYAKRPDLDPKYAAAFEALGNAFGISSANRNNSNTDRQSNSMIDDVIAGTQGTQGTTGAGAFNSTFKNLNDIDYSKFFGPNISDGYVKALDGSILYEQEPGDASKKGYKYNPVPDNSMNNLGRIYNFLSNTNDMFFGSDDKNGDGAADGTFRDWRKKKNLNDIDRVTRGSVDFEIDVSPANQKAIQDYINESLKAGTDIDPSVFYNFDLSNIPANKRANFNNWLNTQKENAKNIGQDVKSFINDDAVPFFDGLGDDIGSGIGKLYRNYYEKKRSKAEEQKALKNIITDDVDTPINIEDVKVEEIEEEVKFGGQLKQTPSGKKGKGLRKLPRQVRNKMGYMKYGGPKGEDVYLARKDAAIKASMNKAEKGGEPDNEGFRALPDFVQDKIMKRKYGGNDLPKAQTNIDFSALFNNQGMTNYMQDTQDVADAFLQNRFPDLGSTPLEENNQAIVDSLNNQTDQQLAQVNPGQNINPAKFTFNPDTSLSGLAKDVYNSNAMKTFEDVGAFGVVGSSVVNDVIFGDKDKDDAYVNLFNQTGADSQFNVQAPPFIKGKGLSVNDSMFGSEDDATTGLFLNQGSTRTSKRGGSINSQTVNVGPAMLAKLIAAGADIEML